MALNNKKSKITLKENNIFAKWRISNPNVEIVKNTNNQNKSQTNNFSGNILEESQPNSQANIGFEDTE